MCKWSGTLWPVGRVRLFANYTIPLSLFWRFIWRRWSTKMLVRYILTSVCLWFNQFSQLFLILYMYMGLCVFSLPNSSAMIVQMYTLSYYHHQSVSYLGLGHETMVCAVCLTMFLWRSLLTHLCATCEFNHGHHLILYFILTDAWLLFSNNVLEFWFLSIQFPHYPVM